MWGIQRCAFVRIFHDPTPPPHSRSLCITSSVALTDFSSFLDNPALSDIDFVISNRENRRATLPAHRVVLCAASPVFAALIQGKTPFVLNQDTQIVVNKNDPRPQLRLVLNSQADAEAARLIFRSIYSNGKAMASLGAEDEGAQLQLLAALRLGVRCGVAGAVAAAAWRLQAAAAADGTSCRSWAAVMAILELPEDCFEALSAETVESARQSLLRELGDLDVTMSDEERVKQLEGLPVAAVTSLLSSEETRASCEEVALAAATWYSAQGSAKHAARLAECLRLGWLSPVTLSVVVRRLDWLQAAVGQEQLLDIIAFAAGPSDYKRMLIDMDAGLISTNPAWFKTGGSQGSHDLAQERVMSFSVESIAAAIDSVVAGGEEVKLRGCEPVFIRGFTLQPELHVEPYCIDGEADSKAGAMLTFAVATEFCSVKSGPKIPWLDAKWECTLLAAHSGTGAWSSRTSMDFMPSPGCCHCWCDKFELGPLAAWDLAVFEAKGLLKEGDDALVLRMVLKGGE